MSGGIPTPSQAESMLEKICPEEFVAQRLTDVIQALRGLDQQERYRVIKAAEAFYQTTGKKQDGFHPGPHKR